MNYLNIYNNFILDRQHKESNLELFEVHHIIPRSVGGSDDKANLIRLSPQDHLFAHSLLARIYGGGLWHALFMMINERKTHSTKQFRQSYKQSKIKHSEIMAKAKTKEHRLNISLALVNKPKTDKHKKSLSESITGKKLSIEHRKAISISTKGIKKPIGFGEKISRIQKGRKLSETTKDKLRNVKRTREWNESISKSKRDQTLYLFTNGNIVENLTKNDFLVKYGFNRKYIEEMINGKKKTKYKGWSICQI